MVRLLRLLALSAALAAVSASPGSAARIVGMPETLTTQHFAVHYDGAPLTGAPVLHQDAAELAGNLERAYSAYVTQWGYPAPLDDGDGKIDVYVTDLGGAALGLAFPDTAGAQTPGYLHIEASSVREPFVAAHELFHLIQFGIYEPMETWFLESTANWAAFRFLDFPSAILLGGEDAELPELLGAPEMSLNCSGSACGLDGWEQVGYSRWHFFQYVTERFGGGSVREFLDRGKTTNDPTAKAADLIGEVLAGKGSSLADAFTDWAVANLTGSYQAPGLKGLVAPVTASLATGTVAGALPAQTFPVNHLAARYVEFTRGSAGSSGPCYAATLNLSVALPTGLGARPYFRWDGAGGATIPLAVNGSTATLSVPWDTCLWTKNRAVLVLPNPTTTVDAALFTVTGSLSVDRTRFATPTPPAPGSYTGPTVPAPDADAAPTIALYGPETVRVSRRQRALRLVVFSSGAGRLEVEAGGATLGLGDLRAGGNELRFTLPKNLLRALAANGRLRVTSISSGGARGATVTRKLVLTK